MESNLLGANLQPYFRDSGVPTIGENDLDVERTDEPVGLPRNPRGQWLAEQGRSGGVANTR